MRNHLKSTRQRPKIVCFFVRERSGDPRKPKTEKNEKKTVQEPPKSVPRASKSVQERPRTAQERPKDPTEAPKKLPRAPQKAIFSTTPWKESLKSNYSLEKLKTTPWEKLRHLVQTTPWEKSNFEATLPRFCKIFPFQGVVQTKTCLSIEREARFFLLERPSMCKSVKVSLELQNMRQRVQQGNKHSLKTCATVSLGFKSFKTR